MKQVGALVAVLLVGCGPERMIEMPYEWVSVKKNAMTQARPSNRPSNI